MGYPGIPPEFSSGSPPWLHIRITREAKISPPGWTSAFLHQSLWEWDLGSIFCFQSSQLIPMVAKLENHCLQVSLRNSFRACGPCPEFPREVHFSSFTEGSHFGNSWKAKVHQIKSVMPLGLFKKNELGSLLNKESKCPWCGYKLALRKTVPSKDCWGICGLQVWWHSRQRHWGLPMSSGGTANGHPVLWSWENPLNCTIHQLPFPESRVHLEELKSFLSVTCNWVWGLDVGNFCDLEELYENGIWPQGARCVDNVSFG